MNVVIVDDVLPNALLIKGLVRRIDNVTAMTFTDPVEALAWCEANRPDLIMLDYTMPRMDGVTFLTRFREVEHLTDVPVVVITAEQGQEALYSALDAGANDFLKKPVDHVELIARTRNMLRLRARQVELSEANEKLYVMATTDALTGVHNRRYFLEKTRHEIGRSRRYKNPLSLAILDADFFKHVNDNYGHAAGDAVLRTLAQRCVDQLRTVDIVGRVGGEEFGLCLPETPVENAYGAIERLRIAVAERPIDFEGTPIQVTVSLGLTGFRADDDTDIIFRRADTALYDAKAKGRNRVVLA